MEDFDNPFADYGQIVSGPRFIGRVMHLQEIEGRVIRPPGGNLAIVGQRRVGKSSLAHQAVMIRREELLARRILPIWIATSTYDSPQQFFSDLVSTCFRQLVALDWATRLIREAASEVASRTTPQFSFGVLKEFFQETHAAGIRIIVILDEFDKSTRFAPIDPSFFDRLRELSYHGQTTLITISRDPIVRIEQRSNITSTLAGVFHDLFVDMFNKAEIEEHFARLATLGINLTPQDQQQFDAQSGGHPYLRDMLAFHLVEQSRRFQQIRMDQAIRLSERSLMREFACIIEHLRNNELLEPLTETIFASSAHIRSTTLHELESYGIIHKTANGRYAAFSSAFQDYLSQELPHTLEELSKAERRVLYSLRSGLSNREIAGQLDISEHTVKTHVSNILRKLRVENREAAVRRARELDLLE